MWSFYLVLIYSYHLLTTCIELYKIKSNRLNYQWLKSLDGFQKSLVIILVVNYWRGKGKDWRFFTKIDNDDEKSLALNKSCMHYNKKK